MSRTVFSLTAIVLGLVILVGCTEDGRYGITFINQGTHVIESGQQMTSDVAIVGGSVTFEDETQLTGTIYLFGGELTLNGEVEGDVAALGGSILLEDQSSISGDFYVAGSDVTRAAGATIAGEETNLSAQELGLGQRRSALDVVWQAVSTTLVIALIAGLSVRLMPTLTKRLARTSTGYPVMSGALGVLMLLIFPILLVFMAFTIILIPLTLIGGFVLALLVGYGVIGLGRGVGERVSRWRSWPLSPSVSAAIGTGAISFALNLIALVPIAAEISMVVVGAVAFGSVVLSGFGTRVYEPPEDITTAESHETIPA
jgi:hypothetical protein